MTLADLSRALLFAPLLAIARHGHQPLPGQGKRRHSDPARTSCCSCGVPIGAGRPGRKCQPCRTPIDPVGDLVKECLS